MRKRGQFFIGVGLILLSLMGIVFLATTRAFRPSAPSSAAHSLLIEAEVMRAMRSAFANASSRDDVSGAFNNMLVRSYLNRITEAEDRLFVDFEIVEPASRGDGTVNAKVRVTFDADETRWNMSVPLLVRLEILSMTVAGGTSPQFEELSLKVLVTLNNVPDPISSALFAIIGGSTTPCAIVARYSDGSMLLQAQVPTGWTDARLVIVDINGIRVWASLKHPP